MKRHAWGDPGRNQFLRKPIDRICRAKPMGRWCFRVSMGTNAKKLECRTARRARSGKNLQRKRGGTDWGHVGGFFADSEKGKNDDQRVHGGRPIRLQFALKSKSPKGSSGRWGGKSIADRAQKGSGNRTRRAGAVYSRKAYRFHSPAWGEKRRPSKQGKSQST